MNFLTLSSDLPNNINLILISIKSTYRKMHCPNLLRVQSSPALVTSLTTEI